MTATAPGPLLVMGAGSIGCFIGASLQAAGADVHFVGRPRVIGHLRHAGLTLTDLEGRRQHLPAAGLHLYDALPNDLAPALVLLTVKSAATAEAAALLARAVPPGTPVLSLQNGIGNADSARRAAPALEVIAGMVPFNVAEVVPGTFHRGSDGILRAREHDALQPWLPLFETAGLPLRLHAEMRSVQWAKLLLNLNNPVNALSGLPLRRQLLARGYRRVLAELQAETLQLLDVARIEPARLTPLPPRWMPQLLRLPTPLFRVVAARLLRVDERARSSMADDVARGRPTEIDALCGEVVRLAQGLGLDAPVNARISTLVQDLAVAPRRYTPRELLAALRAGTGVRSGSGSASKRSNPV